MTYKYKAAAKEVRVENIGRHIEVWVEEAEGGIKAFYIAPDGIGLKILSSYEEYMDWTTK